MEWQAATLALQILMLVVGWALFQKARSELSAQAAETPVLNEIRALHRNVKALVSELEATGDRTSERLERRCEQARELLARLELRMESSAGGSSESENGANLRLVSDALPKSHPLQTRQEEESMPKVRSAPVTRYNNAGSEGEHRQSRRNEIYERADAGEEPARIARDTGLSEGEVETLLGLRARRR